MLISLLFITISCIIIWRSSHGFEIASDYLGRKFPPGIKGATLNAIASSMPEFLTTMFFLFYLRSAEGFSGGLGVTSGSALFNLLIIPAFAVLMLYSMGKGKKIILNKKVLLREGIVLLIAQVVFVSFLFKGDLLASHGLILVLFYMLYLGLLFVITKRNRTSDPGFESPEDKTGRSMFIRIITLDITHTILKRKKIDPGSAWLLLLVSTLAMTFGTWLLVIGTDLFGHETGIPLIFVAVVLSAAATSVPDTIISIKDARKGNYDDALSNALGSNIFDIAFALGFPVLLYNLIYGDAISLPDDVLAFTKEVWVFLLLSTFIALAIMFTGKYFNRLKAFLLLGIYALFLLFVGTQVEEGLQGIGHTIGGFLENMADLIGGFFN
ncbi:MAG: sodium:calcium antiporter [Bacteroidales bacterium]|nr:sodium:calcium antiporter [Bacteroidales bacterium]